jgi:hypothetical protein
VAEARPLHIRVILGIDRKGLMSAHARTHGFRGAPEAGWHLYQADRHRKATASHGAIFPSRAKVRVTAGL